MNILFLSNGWRGRASKSQFRFVQKLLNFCNLYTYGPKEGDSGLVPILYDPYLSIDEITSRLEIDLILFHMWHTCYGEYGKWLPEGLENINIPKVMFEVDYWSMPDKTWYNKMGIRLIIQRGIFEEEDIPFVYLPFSIDDIIFKPCCSKCEESTNKVLFTGATNKHNPYYTTRRLAIDKLENAGLLAYKANILVRDYHNLINKYTVALSCGAGTLMNPVIKTFEYMASGVAVLCSPMKDSKLLFGDEECFYEYDIDACNVVEIAKEALSNVDKRNRIINNAYKIVHKMHLDSHRIVEFYNILKAVVYDIEIPKKWSLE